MREGELKQWHTMLADEHKELHEELERLSEMYERSLAGFSSSLRSMTEEEITKERTNLLSIRNALGNAMRRLEISCKDADELMDEWREWEMVQHRAKAPLDPDQIVRISMLRSELEIRGLIVPRSEEGDVASIEEVAQEELPLEKKGLASGAWIVEKIEEPDELAEWEEVKAERTEPECARLTEQMQALLEQQSVDEKEALAMVKNFRHTHGALKLLDRRAGIRRNRLVAFEV
jgi:hypothetical protein